MITFEFNNGKARWTDGKDSGNWQSVKTDKQGQFIRKGTEKLYLPKEDVEMVSQPEPASGQIESTPPAEVSMDDHDAKVYWAYYETKTFWNKRFNLPDGASDYYVFRSKIGGYDRSFFAKK